MAVSFQQQKQQALQLFQGALKIAQSLNDEENEKALREAMDRLAQGKLFVVVCGEFKQGKSSLINALVNQADLFPVDVDITTNLVSSIGYGEVEQLTVMLGERGQEKPRKITRDEISDYVTEQKNPNNERQARMLVVEAPNPVLKDGMVLVDTPGVGTINIEHTDATYAYLPNADVVLFVSDALKPLTTEELRFLSDKVARHCENVLFVLTKIDKNSEYRTVLENNREKIASALKRRPDEVPIVPVSSHLKLSWLKSKDEEDLEESNFPTLEAALWNQLNEQRGSIILSRSVVDLGRAVSRMKGPIDAEWEACQQHSKEELDQLEKNFEDGRERLQTLLENDATWRTMMQRGLAQIRTEITTEFQTGFVQVRRHAVEALDDGRLLERPDQLLNMVQVDIDAVLAEVGRQLAVMGSELHDRIESSTGMDMNPFQAGALVADKARVTYDIQMKTKWEGALLAARQNSWAMSLGSSLMGMAGGIVGGGIGLLFFGVGVAPGAMIGASIGSSLGLIGGLATGVKRGLKDAKMANKPEMAKMINQFIDDSQRICNKSLTEALSGMEWTVQDELMSQIKREKKSAESTLKSIQEARKLTQEGTAKRVAELKGPVQQLTQLQKAIETVTEGLVQQVLRVPQVKKKLASKPAAPVQQKPAAPPAAAQPRPAAPPAAAQPKPAAPPAAAQPRPAAPPAAAPPKPPAPPPVEATPAPAPKPDPAPPASSGTDFGDWADE